MVGGGDVSKRARVPSTPRRAVTRGAGPLTEVRVPQPTASLPGRQRAYRTASGCSVIVGREPALAAPAGIWVPPEALELWHVSIAHPSRYPTWDEVADVRYALVPDDVTMAMLLPPRDEYVNLHQHTFHLWQIDDQRTS